MKALFISGYGDWGRKFCLIGENLVKNKILTEYMIYTHGKKVTCQLETATLISNNILILKIYINLLEEILSHPLNYTSRNMVLYTKWR